MKKWLIKIFKKILRKLDPTIFEEAVITHSHKPLVTIEANCSLDKWDMKRISEENIKEILARRLGEQIIDRMDILTATSYDSPLGEERVHYRAKVQIADNNN